MRRVSMRRLLLQTLPLTLLLCSLFVVQTGFQPVSLVAGDNVDGFSDVDNTIFDRYWDSRLFDGTIGYDGFIKWLHNPAGMPAGLAQADFEAEIEAAFNNWDAVDDTSPENPLVPIVNLAGPATATDAFALDGENAVVWKAGEAFGNLVITPCWFLTEPTTTIDDGAGNTLLPLQAAPPDIPQNIPFPGPPGVALTPSGRSRHS